MMERCAVCVKRRRKIDEKRTKDREGERSARRMYSCTRRTTLLSRVAKFFLRNSLSLLFQRRKSSLRGYVLVVRVLASGGTRGARRRLQKEDSQESSSGLNADLAGNLAGRAGAISCSLHKGLMTSLALPLRILFSTQSKEKRGTQLRKRKDFYRAQVDRFLREGGIVKFSCMTPIPIEKNTRRTPLALVTSRASLSSPFS